MIHIIGAGPIGCFLGEMLSRKGKKTTIYEEHKVIGKPVQCTGIVTKDIGNLVKLNGDIIVNRLKKTVIHSPDNKRLELKTEDIVIDRQKFDSFLSEKAKAEGAKIIKNKKITKIKGTEKVIGADGPRSALFPNINPNLKRKYFIGYQAKVKGSFHEDCYDVFLGKEFRDFFGWIVPENNRIARIGLASNRNDPACLQRFLNKLKIEKKDILEHQGGLIPRYDPKVRWQKGNIYIVGDAALQVKETTGGGIIQGMIGARELARCIIDDKDYKARKLRLELYAHHKIRKALDNFSDKDYNLLVKYFNKKDIKEILNKTSRDKSFSLGIRLMLEEPRLIRFITKVF